jgi:hypothetical protein
MDLGHNQLGLVLADIAGKGIAAALLMANLQANLRRLRSAATVPALGQSVVLREHRRCRLRHILLCRVRRCDAADMRIAAISLLSCCGATVQSKG